MPPARRRRPPQPATDAVQNAVDTALAAIARLDTPDQPAKAATDAIAALDQGKRRVARADIDAVVEFAGDRADAALARSLRTLTSASTRWSRFATNIWGARGGARRRTGTMGGSPSVPTVAATPL
jgi:hypothetical protein